MIANHSAEAVIPWAVKPGAAKTAADSSADHHGPALRASCSHLTGQAGVVFGCVVPVAPLILVRVFALCLPRRIWSHQEDTRRGMRRDDHDLRGGRAGRRGTAVIEIVGIDTPALGDRSYLATDGRG